MSPRKGSRVFYVGSPRDSRHMKPATVTRRANSRGLIEITWDSGGTYEAYAVNLEPIPRLSPAQRAALDGWAMGSTRYALDHAAKPATLDSLVKLGLLRDLTRYSSGGALPDARPALIYRRTLEPIPPQPPEPSR